MFARGWMWINVCSLVTEQKLKIWNSQFQLREIEQTSCYYYLFLQDSGCFFSLSLSLLINHGNTVILVGVV